MTEIRITLDKIEMSMAGGELCLRFISGFDAAIVPSKPALEYRTVAQIAQRTQYCPKTVRNWVNREGCPARRVNGDIRFLDHEVDEWMAAHKIGGVRK